MPEAMPWDRVGPEYKKDRKRAGILIDLRRCVGCHACSVSCKTENEVPLGGFRMRVRYLERPDTSAQIAFTPLICMQCQDAPCLKACPSKAIKRAEDGRVLIDEGRCDVEQECISACPYGAIFINEEKDVAEKCDLCQHRTDVGLDPACVSSCPSDALQFADFDDPEDPVTKMAAASGARGWKEDEGTRPSVLYIDHEPWMEEKANTGVQLDENDEDIIYEQNNLKKGKNA
ncbi:MAG: 4Fe-4S dicluster domain-containing protein [Verrucomicrobiota bacterium]